MAIHQTARQSDLEKRLKLLRQQVYGKEFKALGSELVVKDNKPTNYEPPTTNSASDITYLRNDLLKIVSLSALAIGAQVILFLLSKNHILKLNLF